MKLHLPSPGRSWWLILSAGSTLCIAGCAEGWKATEAETRDWLPGAVIDLKRVVVLLRTCQPQRTNGYHTIWVDGSDDDVKPHCGYGDDNQISEIRKHLRAANVLGVSYWPSGSSTEPIAWAEFILFREGIVTSGSATSVMYHAQPKPCVGTREGDADYFVLTRPITGSPCRWFWQRSVG